MIWSLGLTTVQSRKTADDLFDSKPSPSNESITATAAQWAERIMRKIDNVFSG
jgi:hypothetical protein